MSTDTEPLPSPPRRAQPKRVAPAAMHVLHQPAPPQHSPKIQERWRSLNCVESCWIMLNHVESLITILNMFGWVDLEIGVGITEVLLGHLGSSKATEDASIRGGTESVSRQRLLQCSWTPNSTVTFWPFLGNSGCAILQPSFILRMSGVIFHLMIMTWAKAGDTEVCRASEGPWALEKLSCEVSLTIFQAHHTGKQVDSSCHCHPLWIYYDIFGSYVYTYCILSLSCLVH